MKRSIPLLLALAVVLSTLLTACGGGPVSDIYTAAGDATVPDDLTRTRNFRPDDDLNVVVTLNAHNRELPVYAIFNAPSGAVYGTDTIEAGQTVGEILLGLDWEASGSVDWPVGEWTVDIYVDDQREESVRFTVAPREAANQG